MDFKHLLAVLIVVSIALGSAHAFTGCVQSGGCNGEYILDTDSTHKCYTTSACDSEDTWTTYSCTTPPSYCNNIMCNTAGTIYDGINTDYCHTGGTGDDAEHCLLSTRCTTPAAAITVTSPDLSELAKGEPVEVSFTVGSNVPSVPEFALWVRIPWLDSETCDTVKETVTINSVPYETAYNALMGECVATITPALASRMTGSTLNAGGPSTPLTMYVTTDHITQGSSTYVVIFSLKDADPIIEANSISADYPNLGFAYTCVPTFACALNSGASEYTNVVGTHLCYTDSECTIEDTESTFTCSASSTWDATCESGNGNCYTNYFGTCNNNDALCKTSTACSTQPALLEVTATPPSGTIAPGETATFTAELGANVLAIPNFNLKVKVQWDNWRNCTEWVSVNGFLVPTIYDDSWGGCVATVTGGMFYSDPARVNRAAPSPYTLVAGGGTTSFDIQISTENAEFSGQSWIEVMSYAGLMLLGDTNGNIDFKASCPDGIKNGLETDIDCGGPDCADCGCTQSCNINSDPYQDCTAPAWCSSSYGVCYCLGTCTDGILNKDETDIDCGGNECGWLQGKTCALGKDCRINSDCTSSLCSVTTHKCIDQCSDGIKDGAETDVDCGGGTCNGCDTDKSCSGNSDCISSYCNPSTQKCGSSCTSGFKDGSESAVDCGGDSDCGTCSLGQWCWYDSNCESGYCGTYSYTCVSAAEEENTCTLDSGCSAYCNLGGNGYIDLNGNCHSTDQCGEDDYCYGEGTLPAQLTLTSDSEQYDIEPDAYVLMSFYLGENINQIDDYKLIVQVPWDRMPCSENVTVIDGDSYPTAYNAYNDECDAVITPALGSRVTGTTLNAGEGLTSPLTISVTTSDVSYGSASRALGVVSTTSSNIELSRIYTWVEFASSAPDPCSNEVKDGDETDIDCGGGTCAECANGDACVANSDCTSDYCESLTCQNAPAPEDSDGDGTADIYDVCSNPTAPSTLAGYWGFEEGDDINAYDSYGGHTGSSISDAIYWNAVGKLGTAIDITGSANHGIMTLTSVSNLKPEHPSVEAWIKPASLTTDKGRFIIDGDAADSIRGWAIVQNVGNVLCFGITNDDSPRTSQTACSTTIVDTSHWYHVVGTYDGSNVKLYLNGELQDTEPFTKSITYATDPIILGQYYGYPHQGYDFDGSIDEVAIYDGALPAEEIAAHYNSGTGEHYCEVRSEGVGCVSSNQCDTGLICTDNICTAPTQCTNGINDVDETGVDCGGPTCPTCEAGQACSLNSDCTSDICTEGICAEPPSCSDGINNQDETGVDCGGPTCGLCENGESCILDSDCGSDMCSGGICSLPISCYDGDKNQDESASDCGGVCAVFDNLKCSLGRSCNKNFDCESGACSGGTCVNPCVDLTTDFGESGTDCGGTSVCGDCPLGETCVTDYDCASGFCQFGACVINNRTFTWDVANIQLVDITDVGTMGGTLGFYKGGEPSTFATREYIWIGSDSDDIDLYNPLDLYVQLHSDGYDCGTPAECIVALPWSAPNLTITKTVDQSDIKVLETNINLLPGFQKDLLVPKLAGTDYAYCCPFATTLDDVYEGCTGMFTTTESFLDISFGTEYWVCVDMQNSGAGVNGNANLTIFDDYESSSAPADTYIDFYAYYYNNTNAADTITPAEGGGCWVEFDDAWGTLYDMSLDWNGTHYIFNKTAGFSSGGTHLWNVTCNDTTATFSPITDLQDDIDVTPPVGAPEFSDLAYVLAAVLGVGSFVLVRKFRK